MLALLISIGISIAMIIICSVSGVSSGGTIASGIAGFIIPQVILGFYVRKKTKGINAELQEIMLSGQKRIQTKVHQFQNKPGADVKLMQRQIERDQKEIYKKALDFLPKLDAMKKWNLLMGKQTATMRMQFLYQLKEFDQVDALLAAGFMARPMMMEPMAVAMKMARQYKKKDIEGAEKTFKRHIRWFRGERGTLLYALLSWIYVKQGDSEKARVLLIKGKEATENDAIAHNWEMLANNKEKKFSNADIGEEWYGLYLENPPAPKQQRMRGNQRGGRRF